MARQSRPHKGPRKTANPARLPGRQHARHQESWRTKIIYADDSQPTALFAESGLSNSIGNQQSDVDDRRADLLTVGRFCRRRAAVANQARAVLDRHVGIREQRDEAVPQLVRRPFSGIQPGRLQQLRGTA